MRMLSDFKSTLDVPLQKEFLKGISAAAVASGEFRELCKFQKIKQIFLVEILDAWIITSGYKAEDVSELIGEIVYKSRIRNSEINFTAFAVGKWGNIQDCCALENRSEQESISGRCPFFKKTMTYYSKVALEVLLKNRPL